MASWNCREHLLRRCQIASLRRAGPGCREALTVFTENTHKDRNWREAQEMAAHRPEEQALRPRGLRGYAHSEPWGHLHPGSQDPALTRAPQQSGPYFPPKHYFATTSFWGLTVNFQLCEDQPTVASGPGTYLLPAPGDHIYSIRGLASQEAALHKWVSTPRCAICKLATPL